ncbi:ABC transporter [Thiocystis minor]|uniref:ATP-binding cassette domain-containing protein n=1 Tax=Thiocystis minor TaxID=61597 RepID=UPI0019128BD7|nr:ABC transporter ATP-binding protein [Thiocystis minor]MBK5964570.1 ABC transporter [Thiocystis minor]
MTQAAPLLSVRGISKGYGEALVLDDVDFDLSHGEILGIIGPNGAGKTTLMECLVGLLAADGGDVSLGGTPIPVKRRREAMFYLPDGIAPWSDQPVWRVTGLFRELHGFPLDREARVLRWLELTPVMAKRVDALSKGYRRRLLLALALLTPQPILILDEPFDGFDLRQTLHVMDLLREVAAERALILSIHQLKDAERICDRLLLLDAGRRLGLGTLAELAELASAGKADLEEVFLGLTA